MKNENLTKKVTNAKTLDAITTVYSYRFPEIRKIVSDLTASFPHDVFMRSVSPPGALDNFHEPIIDKIVDFYSLSVPKLSDFKNRYPTSGSEEGIREILSHLQLNGVKEIYVLKGEYEGYKAVSETRGISTVEIPFDFNPKDLVPGYFFISNPSARDGNIISNDYINNICDAGHKVFYDMAYLGSTKPHQFDLSHENIFSAVISFSKPYGLFYDRIGFTFAKEKIPALYANKWFKNILGLLIAEKIVNEISPDELYKKYSPIQKSIVDSINSGFDIGMKCSDALLLGNISKDDAEMLSSEKKDLISKFKRDSGYRFCLTPYYVKNESDEKKERYLEVSK